MSKGQYTYKQNVKSIAEQGASIRVRYPNFKLTCNYLHLKAVGELQPTSRSDKYLVEIKYHLRESPKIKILHPELVVNSKGDKIPHVYPGNRLCLYQPKYLEFTPSKCISETIIPWTSLWLYHYEVWHITGDWQGGGEHPNLKDL